MAATYGLRELYGGAITVQLPVELIDSSDLRQIPDHQEVFLSPSSLTSIIFEINNYVIAPDPVTTSTTTTSTASGIVTTSTTTAVFSDADITAEHDTDLAAAAYHFTDVISLPDTLASPLGLAQKITMASPSLDKFPAYVLPGTIISYEPVRRPGPGQNQPPLPPPANPADSASPSTTNPPAASSLEHQQQLLIRLQPYETDLCVRINIPMKEIANDENELKHEERFASEILEHIVATLDVKDFGLFGV
ncbi:uncharacterized protein A1O9_00252 [Exophiala aquamarina CBS 119918]|uniref:Ran-interacting Mog1 protein n=1 Tax=Exophiala aquamarina CBS 119918 TaxID=1182545 RepID=A0A072Q333_9EURO|nr:uncharacterized protein A1O9_00252 [Exophiala aquamarina CBS 119918]KEF62280.1 hypothetical protein A1O9_00252 [Exophiala aquamarina CBS 119918]